MTTDTGSAGRDDRPDLELLARYCIGEATAAEVTAVSEWIEADPSHQAEFDRLRFVLVRPDLHLTTEEVEAGIAAIVAATDGRAVLQNAAPAATRRPIALRFGSRSRVWLPSWDNQELQRRVYRFVLPVVAVAVLLIGGASVRWFTSSRPASKPFVTFATRAGQRATVTLSDGSTVLLNAGSRITYAADFGPGSRDVYLNGEALFRVVRSGGRPFIVHAGPSATRVLGTVFSVRHYTGDTVTRVVVAKGRVALQRVVLTAGDLATSDGRSATVHRGANVEAALAWTTGQLVFHLTPLRDVVTELERWYGVTIRVTNPTLLNAPISLTLQDENVAQAMDLLSVVLRVRVTRTGSVFTLSPEFGSQ